MIVMEVAGPGRLPVQVIDPHTGRSRFVWRERPRQSGATYTASRWTVSLELVAGPRDDATVPATTYSPHISQREESYRGG